MRALIFPGQGSQSKGMGKELFFSVPEFESWESKINEQLGYSVREICLEDPDELLRQTQYTQPCLYIVNALHYLNYLQETDEKPSIFAGHSLGEYNALWAAGAFDFLTGLRLVQKRGELMSKAKDGAMAAVIGLSTEYIAELLSEHSLDKLDIANKNTPEQTVLSGDANEIERAGPVMEAAGASLYMQLPVSAAFHSRYMLSARNTYDEFLGNTQFNELNSTVIANVTGRPYPKGNPDEVIRTFLSQQITQPVEWVKTILFLFDQGVSDFKELGPGEVLTRLVGQIRSAPLAA